MLSSETIHTKLIKTTIAHNVCTINLVFASPKYDSCSDDNIKGCSLDLDDNDDENDVEQRVPFDLNSYSDAANSSMYMSSSSFLLRTQSHNHRYKNKS